MHSAPARALEGRVALVTAGTSGIGRGIADGFLRAGARVVVNGRSTARADAALAGWTEFGDAVCFIAADVSVGAECDRLVDESIAQFGRLDILVNNCGAMSRTGMPSDFVPVHEQPDAAMDFSWNVNVMAAFWCSRRLIPHLREQRFGRIINMSSIAGKVGSALGGPYAVGKHALNGLTKVIALENAEFGITSNAICAGAVETEMMQSEGSQLAVALGISYEDFKRKAADRSLVKRLIEVHEISAMATLLASVPGAAITGQCISVDGGIVLSG
jgi:3-hydroxybutyrate dehydrogenase